MFTALREGLEELCADCYQLMWSFPFNFSSACFGWKGGGGGGGGYKIDKRLKDEQSFYFICDGRFVKCFTAQL